MLANNNVKSKQKILPVVNSAQSSEISPAPEVAEFLNAGFNLVPVPKNEVSNNTMQNVMTEASALPQALMPLIGQLQQNGLYRLTIPDPVIAAQVAQGHLKFTPFKDHGITTAVSGPDGFKGSGALTRAGSIITNAVSAAFSALSFVTFQYYLRVINKQLSDMQEQLQVIINHLEIKSLARFNTCKNKLFELMEDFCAIVNCADKNCTIGDLEKLTFTSQLSFVEQICNELAEETKLALNMKRKELNDMSKKTKLDEKVFEKCAPIIEQSICAYKLKVILLHLIVQKDKQWTPTLLPLNERRLKAASEEIQDIVDFTASAKQLAKDEEKSRGLLTRLWDTIVIHRTNPDINSPYDPIKAKFDAFGQQLTSTANSYLIHYDREQNSAKIMPELKS